MGKEVYLTNATLEFLHQRMLDFNLNTYNEAIRSFSEKQPVITKKRKEHWTDNLSDYDLCEMYKTC